MGLCYMQIVAPFMFTMQLLVLVHAIPKMNQHTISYYVILASILTMHCIRVAFKLNNTWVLCGAVLCRIMLCRVMFTGVVLCPEYCCLSCVLCVHVNGMCMYMLM